MRRAIETAIFLLLSLLAGALVLAVCTLLIMALFTPERLAVFSSALLDPGTWIGEDFSGSKLIEALSKLTGIFTLIGASIAAVIAWIVSNHRRKEAEGVQFREYMKWSVERFSQPEKTDEQYLEQVFAYMLIRRYAEEAPNLLEPADRKLAKQILELIDEVTTSDT